MPPKKRGKSTRAKSANTNETTRTLMLQREYSKAISRTRSAKGAMNAKRKRHKLMVEMKALESGNGFDWVKLAEKRRRVSGPMTALRKTKEILGKSTYGKKERMLTVIESLEEAVKTLLVETEKCIQSSTINKEKLTQMIDRGLDVDRAVLGSFADVFDMQPNFFYATPECQNQILPGSVFQISEWHRNNTRLGGRSIDGSPGKVSCKNKAQGKRHATTARQDIPDTIAEHIPDCV